MHDYFEILGVAPDAHARDIRVACARHAARPRADLLVGEQQQSERLPEGATLDGTPGLTDVAIDMPDMTAVVSRMQAAFFRSPGSR